MDLTMDLIKGYPEELYREKYAKAKATQICMRCGEPVRDLTDPSSGLEYRISALCGTCREEIIHRCLQRGLITAST